MIPQYTILVDGGFLLNKLGQRLKRFPNVSDIVSHCDLIKSNPELEKFNLLRIYFYHAPPPSFVLTNPIDKSKLHLNKSSHFKDSARLLESLEMQPNFALRLGETVSRGWKLGRKALKSISEKPREINATDLVPDIQQKGVDLRIGLDIARLSLLKLVNIIVVITGDRDLIPAFKFARREGIRVYLDHLDHGVYRDLKAHTDLIL